MYSKRPGSQQLARAASYSPTPTPPFLQYSCSLRHSRAVISCGQYLQPTASIATRYLVASIARSYLVAVQEKRREEDENQLRQRGGGRTGI